MTGSLARPAAAGRNPPATPALLPSSYLLAALALLVLAPPALLGWLAGAWVVRCGWVSRGRLASAGGVTGTLALVLIGRTVATGRWPPRGCRGHPQHRPAGHPDRRRRARGPERDPAPRVGLAAVTVPAGVAIAAIPPRQGLAVRPEWIERHATWEGFRPRLASAGREPGRRPARWRIGDLIVPPPRPAGSGHVAAGQPGVGKTVAIARLAYLAAKERRHLTVVNAKGGHDGLAGDVVSAVLQAWPQARVGLFPSESGRGSEPCGRSLFSVPQPQCRAAGPQSMARGTIVDDAYSACRAVPSGRIRYIVGTRPGPSSRKTIHRPSGE